MMTAYKYIFVFTKLKGFAINAKQLQIEKKISNQITSGSENSVKGCE